MEHYLYNLKYTAKQLKRNSAKFDKTVIEEKEKVKKAIKKGDIEVARIHAENAIRQKNVSTTYLRMSARIDAVATRIQTAITTKHVTESMLGVVRSIDLAMKSMNLEKISLLMDKFERQFEDLDVQSACMEKSMTQSVTTTIPECDVDNLLKQVADEAGLELNMELPSAVAASSSVTLPIQPSQDHDELTRRLAKLRQNE